VKRLLDPIRKGVWPLLALTLAAACGSGGGNADPNGHGGSGGTLGDGGGLTVGPGSGGGDGEVCAGTVYEAEPVGVDLVVMLDKSLSMWFPTGAGDGGQMKWEAVTQALASFFTNAGAADGEDLEAHLAFFPPTPSGMPAQCTAAGQCGTSLCPLGVCSEDLSKVCEKDADCSATCDPIGLCGYSANGCFDPGSDCGGDTCLDFPRGCAFEPTCDPADFAQPSAVGALPDGASTLIAALQAEAPTGNGTPMVPALTGALQHAWSIAAQNPSRRQAVILATDGAPSTCGESVSQVAQVAAQGVTGSAEHPSVSTFVIGVFGPDDPNAPSNMDQIASAGGTEHAFMVDTTQDVSAEFLAALESIQTQLSCQYQVPEPQGGAIASDQVNVVHTPSGGAPTKIPFVGDAGSCGADGGWYYAPDGQQSTVVVCSSTCNSFQAQGGAVEIEVGCATVVK
jgi:hypothetical protein